MMALGILIVMLTQEMSITWRFYKGEMIEKKSRVRILTSEIEEDKMMEVSAVISEAESSLIDRL